MDIIVIYKKLLINLVSLTGSCLPVYTIISQFDIQCIIYAQVYSIYSKIVKIIKPPRGKFTYNCLNYLTKNYKQYIQTAEHNLEVLANLIFNFLVEQSCFWSISKVL